MEIKFQKLLKSLKQKTKHITLDERLKKFERLSSVDKGNIEPYDWGKDLGNEKFY